ncbi:MAG: transcription termination factor NusA [Candidatus Liptonbacteria bacterium]|nr:transcription termination factor NusA [Candidatus Liptonbacteria bacterium]
MKPLSAGFIFYNMDFKQLLIVADQVAREKNLNPEKIIEIIEDSIAAAYRREHGQRGEIIKTSLNKTTGELKFWQIKEVIDENIIKSEGQAVDQEDIKLIHFHPERHISLSEAQKINPEAVIGDKIEFTLKPENSFGRIAVQSAKQVILQKLREAEKEEVLREYKNREGKIISGVVHRFDRGNVLVDLGRCLGIMFSGESIPGERYQANQRMRFYVLAVQEDNRGQPGIILSRSHPDFIVKLFEMEVPEIAEGLIEIKEIAREAGIRTKIAVAAKFDGIDAIGSCVGQRGTRIMAINNEISQEKIDIIEWSEEVEKFVANALSPAKVKSVEIFVPKEARVIMAEDQLSLAIGKNGQNVRLAAKLTGTKIDIRSETRPEEIQKEGVVDAFGSPLTEGQPIVENEKLDKIEEGKIIPKYRDDED